RTVWISLHRADHPFDEAMCRSFSLLQAEQHLYPDYLRRRWRCEKVDSCRLKIRNDFLSTFCPLRSPNRELRVTRGKFACRCYPVKESIVSQTPLNRAEF